MHNVQALNDEMQPKYMHNVQPQEVEMQLPEMHNVQALEVKIELKDILKEAENRLFLNSLPETCYNYTLSKYGAGVLFPPLVQKSQHGEGEPVPIFSCSRSAVRDLVFPELEDLLFPLQDAYLESEEEDDCCPIQVVTHSDIQAKEAVLPSSSSAAPDGYPPNTNFYSQRGWRGNWKSLLSLRRIRFPGKGSTNSSWCWRSGAWVSPALGQAQRARPPPITPSSQADTIVNAATRTSHPPPEVIHL
ncbi:unnamed protein product [Coregonus sp. 'balchen']|nr:unnamed protein product [Coregonus sp. 'balchen']